MKYLIYNQNETQQTKVQKQEILYFLASDQSDQWDPTSQDEHGGVAVTFESKLKSNCCDMWDQDQSSHQAENQTDRLFVPL